MPSENKCKECEFRPCRIEQKDGNKFRLDICSYCLRRKNKALIVESKRKIFLKEREMEETRRMLKLKFIEMKTLEKINEKIELYKKQINEMDALINH